MCGLLYLKHCSLLDERKKSPSGIEPVTTSRWGANSLTTALLSRPNTTPVSFTISDSNDKKVSDLTYDLFQCLLNLSQHNWRHVISCRTDLLIQNTKAKKRHDKTAVGVTLRDQQVSPFGSLRTHTKRIFRNNDILCEEKGYIFDQNSPWYLQTKSINLHELSR